MAKIEIVGTPDELERIGTFLLNNNVRFKIVDDFANHSFEESVRYKKLIEKFE
jgi:hypothetical protein